MKRKLSRRQWMERANSAELQTIVEAERPDLREWSTAFISPGPRFYAQRVMERTAKKYSARLVGLQRDALVLNPVTQEPNWLWIASFERFDA